MKKEEICECGHERNAHNEEYYSGCGVILQKPYMGKKYKCNCKKFKLKETKK